MYAKLFDSMFDGTLATKGPWEAIVTFQQMLILSDPDGFVDMTPEAIARRTTIPLDIIKKGIAALEQPDPDSRRPDEDGRRIVRIDDHRSWGWQIVNFVHYHRERRTAEQKREASRLAMQKKRDRERAAKALANVNGLNAAAKKLTNVSHTDLDVDVDESKTNHRGRRNNSKQKPHWQVPSLDDQQGLDRFARDHGVNPQAFASYPELQKHLIEMVKAENAAKRANDDVA